MGTVGVYWSVLQIFLKCAQQEAKPSSRLRALIMWQLATSWVANPPRTLAVSQPYHAASMAVMASYHRTLRVPRMCRAWCRTSTQTNSKWWRHRCEVLILRKIPKLTWSNYESHKSPPYGNWKNRRASSYSQLNSCHKKDFSKASSLARVLASWTVEISKGILNCH